MLQAAGTAQTQLNRKMSLLKIFEPLLERKGIVFEGSKASCHAEQ